MQGWRTSDLMATETIYCARHPSTETLLRCGRCDTPICPKCAVFTDVGARCPDCAPRRKLPQFELDAIYIVRAIGASAVAGTVIGGIWGAVLPGGFGFFMVFIGLGIGWAVSEAVALATNRKSGPTLQGIAAGGVVLAYFLRNIVADSTLVITDDFGGLIALIAGVIFAINRLRY
jgi:hypothetical protein